MYDIIELNKKLVGELREIADKLEIKKADKLKKEDLIYQILDQQAINPKAVVDVKKEDNPQPKKPTPAASSNIVRRSSALLLRIVSTIFNSITE